MGPLEGSVLGLLVAFTFADAAEGYDARRELVVRDANALGDAWARLDTPPMLALLVIATPRRQRIGFPAEACVMRTLAVCAGLLGLAGRAIGDDIAAAAAAAVEAWRAKDVSMLRAIAGRDQPDPWSVADEVFAMAGVDAALAFAEAAPRKDTEGLPALVRSWRESPPDPAFREVCRGFNAASVADDAAGVAHALQGLAEPAEPLQRARFAIMRGRAEHMAGRNAEAFDQYVDAAARFEALGALGRQARALSDAALCAQAAKRPDSAVMAWEKRVAIEERRGRRDLALDTLLEIESAHRERKDHARAKEVLVRALGIAREIRDAKREAAVVGRLGPSWLLVGLEHQKLGDPAAAEAAFREAAALLALAKEPNLGGIALQCVIAACEKRGDDEEALAFAERWLLLWSGPESRKGLGAALDKVATLRHRTGDTAGALAARLRALALAREEGERKRLVEALFGMGAFLHETGAYDESRDTLTEALSMAEGGDLPKEEGNILARLGNVHDAAGNHRQAVEAWKRALAIADRIGDRKLAEGCVHNLTVMLLNDMHLPREALPFYERELRWAEETGDPERLAKALYGMAIARIGAKQGQEALVLLERERSLVEQLGKPRPIAENRANLGAAHGLIGDYAQAFPLLEEALRLFHEIDDASGAADVLLRMAKFSHDSGDYRKAREHDEAALEILDSLVEPYSTAVALGNLAVTLTSLGDDAGALAALERALPICRSQGFRSEESRALSGIGDIHYSRGNLREARDYHQRALQIGESIDDRERIAEAHRDLGNTHMRLGECSKAHALLERALAEYEAMHDSAAISNVCNDLGNLHMVLADCGGALPYYERALKIDRDRGSRWSEAVVLGNLGGLHLKSGDRSAALEVLERSLAIKQQIGNLSGCAITLGNIGSAYQRLGETRKALEAHVRALELARQAGDRLQEARLLSSIAQCHATLGDDAEAGDRAADAIRTARETGAQDILADSLSDLAEYRLASGDAAGAIEACRESVELLGRMATGLADEESARFRDDNRSAYRNGLSAACRAADAAAVCFFLESGRGATLVESLGGRDALRDAAIPDQLRQEEAEARAQERDATFRHQEAIRLGARAAIRGTRERLDAAQAQVVSAVERIRRHAKAAAGVVYPFADPLDAVRARLAPDEALLLYGYYPPDAVALLVTWKGARIVPLQGSKEIERASEPALWGELRDVVAAPLQLPDSIHRLLISPAGPLCSVPFTLIFPDHEIAYVASATAQGLLADLSKERGEGVLALGDPDYGRQPSASELSVLRSGVELLPLPASRDEARAVGDTVLLGADATRAKLEAALASKARWRAVHLACHGVIHPEKASLSSLAFANGEMLTTMDVLRMKISADLIVLSACETAKGRVYETEGVIGFVRAFMLAGSPRVLVSLWAVDDNATAALMTEFYKRWKAGAGAAAALRAAQRHIAAQEKWRDPKYWAAWQLWGLPE